MKAPRKNTPSFNRPFSAREGAELLARIDKLQEALTSMDASAANLADEFLATAMSSKLILAQLVSRHIAIASDIGASSAASELALLKKASRDPIAARVTSGDEAQQKLWKSVLLGIDKFFARVNLAAELIDQAKSARNPPSAH
jgi:hypothetical protein